MKKVAVRYYLTALPTVAELGSKPPLELAELRAMLESPAWIREPVDAVLLQDDLLQRESFLAGESADVAPAVLTPAQARNEAPLPDALQIEADGKEDHRDPNEIDQLWGNYFRYVMELSRDIQCPILREWTGYEVGLRNALATARAERLGLTGDGYLVASELESLVEDFDDLIGECKRADEPLAAQRLLIRARWDWVNEHGQWFSFRTDELAAYALKLMLLHQMYRLDGTEESDAPLDGGAGAMEEESK